MAGYVCKGMLITLIAFIGQTSAQQCPPYTLGMLGEKPCPTQFIGHCTSDGECGDAKCCESGCGLTCLQPVPGISPNEPSQPRPTDQPVTPSVPKQLPSGVTSPDIDSSTFLFVVNEYMKSNSITNGLASYVDVVFGIAEQFKILMSSLSQNARSTLPDNIQKFATMLGFDASAISNANVAVQSAISFRLTGDTSMPTGWSVADVIDKITESLTNAGISTDDVQAVKNALSFTQTPFLLPFMYTMIAGSDNNLNPPVFPTPKENPPVPGQEDLKPAKEDIPKFDLSTLISRLPTFVATRLMATEVSDFLRLQKLTGIQFPAIVMTMPPTRQVTLPNDLQVALDSNGMDPNTIQQNVGDLNTTGEMLPAADVLRQISDTLRQNPDKINPAFVDPIIEFLTSPGIVSVLPMVYPNLLGTEVNKKPVTQPSVICDPSECEYEPWSDWLDCMVSGNLGPVQKKIRNYKAKTSCVCDGYTLEIRQCQTVCQPEDCAWDDWQNWTPCTSIGFDNDLRQLRLRNSIREASCNGASCLSGYNLETRPCQ